MKGFALLSLTSLFGAGCVSTSSHLPLVYTLPVKTSINSEVTQEVRRRFVTNRVDVSYSGTNVVQVPYSGTKEVEFPLPPRTQIKLQELPNRLLKEAELKYPRDKTEVRYLGLLVHDKDSGKTKIDSGMGDGGLEIDTLSTDKKGVFDINRKLRNRTYAEVLSKTPSEASHLYPERYMGVVFGETNRTVRVDYSGTNVVQVPYSGTKTVNTVAENIERTTSTHVRVKEEKDIQFLKREDFPVGALVDSDTRFVGARVAFSGLGDLVKGIGTAIKDITQIIHPYRTKDEEGKQILDKQGRPAKVWLPWWRVCGEQQQYSIAGTFFDSEDGGFLGGWNGKSWDDKAGRLAPFALLFAAGGGGGGGSREEVVIQEREEKKEEPKPEPKPEPTGTTGGEEGNFDSESNTGGEGGGF